MQKLEVFVKFDTGHGRTVSVERDDDRGRENADRIALKWIARDDVVRVTVERSARTGGGYSGR